MKQYKIVVICMCILLLLAGGVYAQQKTVRILAIGNSFSQDAVEQYLHELAEAEGISTIIGMRLLLGIVDLKTTTAINSPCIRLLPMQ